MFLHVVQSSPVVFLWIKCIDGWKIKVVKIRYFIFETKSLAPTKSLAMSFDCKVTIPAVMYITGIAKGNCPIM
jgi:hypothetical protein